MTFTKEHTNVAKGIAIILMFIHHLFSDYYLYEAYNVIFWPLSAQNVVNIAICGKVCVAIFVFLSAYGITRKYMSYQELNITDYSRISWKRLVSILTSFWVIYVLSFIVTFFLDRRPINTYGLNPAGIMQAIIDFLGMSNYLGTASLNATWWYVSFSITIIVIMPFIYKGCKKFRWLFVAAIILCEKALQASDDLILIWYGVALLLGTMCAYDNLFEKFKTNKAQMKSPASYYFTKCSKFIILSAAICLLYYIRNTLGLYGLVDGFGSMWIVFMSYEFLADIKWISVVLQSLGKHSFTMYLIHRFIYLDYARDFIYSCRYGFLIVIVLLAVCWLISVIIEYIKKICRFQKVVDQLTSLV